MRAAFEENAELTWLPEPETTRILDLVLETDLREIGDWHRRAERAHWVGAGQPTTASPARPSDPARSATPAWSAISRPRHSTGSGPRPVRAAPGDRRTLDQSGRTRGPTGRRPALERVLLTATRDGVTASFLNQPLEFDDLRRAVQRATGKPGFAHMVIRFGRGHATATARRPVAEFVGRATHDQADGVDPARPAGRPPKLQTHLSGTLAVLRVLTRIALRG